MTELLEPSSERKSPFIKVLLGISAMLFCGFFLAITMDAVTGFQYFSESKSILQWLLRLALTGAIIVASMAGVELVTGNDQTTDPLYMRAFKLIAVFTIIGFMLLIMAYMDTYFE